MLTILNRKIPRYLPREVAYLEERKLGQKRPTITVGDEKRVVEGWTVMILAWTKTKVPPIKFSVTLEQPLGMNIDQSSRKDSNYSAIVTELTPGGQAEVAGVQVEMHVVALNGESTKGVAFDDIVQTVSKAKTELTPLVISLLMLA